MLIDFLGKPAEESIENIWEVNKIYGSSQHTCSAVWPFKVSWSYKTPFTNCDQL